LSIHSGRRLVPQHQAKKFPDTNAERVDFENTLRTWLGLCEEQKLNGQI
jgi:hypothetical protein